MSTTSCPACHTINHLSARFCRGCGSVMTTHTAQADAHLASLRICAHCNTRCAAAAKFCRGCGEIFADTATQDEGLPPDPLAGLHACPECTEPSPPNVKYCKACGYLFPSEEAKTPAHAPIAPKPPEQYAEYATLFSPDDANQLNDLYKLLDHVEKLAAVPGEEKENTSARAEPATSAPVRRASTDHSSAAVPPALEAITPSEPARLAPAAAITPELIAAAAIPGNAPPPAREPQQTLESPGLVAWKDRLLAARGIIVAVIATALVVISVAAFWQQRHEQALAQAAAEQARKEADARLKAEIEARLQGESPAKIETELVAAVRAQAEVEAEHAAIDWPKDEIRLQGEADDRAKAARLREKARAEAKAKAEAAAKAAAQAEIAKRNAKAESARIEAQAAADKAKNSRNKKTAPPIATAPLEATPTPPPPPKSVDETYRDKSQACDSSVGSFFCKERLRYQLCANRWSGDPKPGEKICLQQQGIQ